MVADSEKLSSLASDYGRFYKRRKLKINVGKSKVLKITFNGDQEPVRVR